MNAKKTYGEAPFVTEAERRKSSVFSHRRRGKKQNNIHYYTNDDEDFLCVKFSQMENKISVR